PADLSPAHLRDDAVRAHGVAAHGDLHPRLSRPLTVLRQLGGERPRLAGPEPPARKPVPAGADPFLQVRDRAGAEGDVDERVAVEDPLALRLRVAAADRDDPARIALLQHLRVAEVRG